MTQLSNPVDPESAAIKKTVTIGYALYALSLVVGISALVAIVLNYIKREDARGTWLESHFTWQIKTFWWSLGLFVLGGLTTVIGVGFIILFGTLIWYIYRIVKGWLALTENKAIA
ncbi:MAG: hypothetical protein WCY07_13855 [Pigmentiphaga sp.]